MKSHVLLPQTLVNRNNRLDIVGLSNDKMKSLCTAKIQLVFPKTMFSHDFHIINSQNNLHSYDGILGVDFFRSNETTIKLDEKILKIHNIVIHLMNFSKNSNFPILKARTITYVKRKVQNSKIKEETFNAR